MMTLIWIGIALLIPVALAGVALFVMLQKRRGSAPHPSELSSGTRAALRPVRQSAESFQALLRSNSDSAKILGPDAWTSAQEIVDKAARLGLVRDQMVAVAERLERQGLDATHPLGVIDRIDAQYSQATNAMDEMTMRITKTSSISYQDVDENESLDGLVSCLQNLGQSFDEAHDTLEITEHE